MSGKTSDIWQFFRQVQVDNVKYTECTVCREKIRFFSGTTNMMNHLKAKHPLSIGSATTTLKARSPGDHGSVGASASVVSAKHSFGGKQAVLNFDIRQCNTDRQKYLSLLVVNFIIRDMRPISVLQGSGFVAQMLYCYTYFLYTSNTMYRDI